MKRRGSGAIHVVAHAAHLSRVAFNRCVDRPAMQSGLRKGARVYPVFLQRFKSAGALPFRCSATWQPMASRAATAARDAIQGPVSSRLVRVRAASGPIADGCLLGGAEGLRERQA